MGSFPETYTDPKVSLSLSPPLVKMLFMFYTRFFLQEFWNEIFLM